MPSLKHRSDGLAIARSREYLRLSMELGRMHVQTLDQVVANWPDTHPGQSLRDKKRAVAAELNFARQRGGGVRRFKAILPVMPFVGDAAVGVISTENDERNDFEAIAEKIDSQIPETVQLATLTLYTTSDSFTVLNESFDRACKAAAIERIGREQRNWLFHQSILTHYVGLSEIYNRVKRTAKHDTADVENGLFFVPSTTPGKEIIDRPYAACSGRAVDAPLFMLGAGLSADDLRHHCEKLQSAYPRVVHEKSYQCVPAPYVEIW